MSKAKKVGRPTKPDNEKKVQVISYIPKMNAKKFSKEIEPIINKYNII
jgi:hypothetical protein